MRFENVDSLIIKECLFAGYAGQVFIKVSQSNTTIKNSNFILDKRAIDISTIPCYMGAGLSCTECINIIINNISHNLVSFKKCNS